ncbi:LHX4 isoform 3, partial [Pongo abelii]
DSPVRRLQPAHPGQVHPEGPGQTLAQLLPQVCRLPDAAGGQVLLQGWERLLQGGLLQVSQNGASAQNVRPASRVSPQPRWSARPRTLSTTCTALLASSATGSWPRGMSSTSWRTGGWCARKTMRRPSRTMTQRLELSGPGPPSQPSSWRH